MRIKGIRHTEEGVWVEVDPEDTALQLAYMLYKSVGLPLDETMDVCVRQGRQVIVKYEEQHTSHSWTEEVIVKDEPTPEQVSTVRMVRVLRAAVHNAQMRKGGDGRK